MVDQGKTKAGTLVTDFESAHLEPQVGIAGFFIDLAILHPKNPGKYVLGIECDGAQYHSSLCARDRDRLRQSLLEDRGWTIHRIWSTDWFRDSARETDFVVKAIEAAVAASDVPAPRRPAPPPTRSGEDIASIPVAIPKVKAVVKMAKRYKEANFLVPKDRQLHEFSPPELSTYVLKVVSIEGPIHEEEVTRRIAALREMKRVGARTAGLVGDTLRLLTKTGQTTERHEGFFMSYGTTTVTVRNREAVTSLSLKKPEFLPPTEIVEAFVQVVPLNEGISPDVAIGEAAQMFGFKSMGRQIRDRLGEQLNALVSQGELRNHSDRLYSRQSPGRR